MFGNPGNPGPFSYSPRGFSAEDLAPQRRGLQHDERSTPLQRNNMSRPSGKSVYMQRKEYSETLNRQSDNFHFRVEHLFTCELDGEEVRSLDDCVAKLKRFDAKGRLWPQEMIMEVQGGYLLLNDIETKAELESLPLNCIQQTKAVLDSCAYNSLLTVTVQEGSKRPPQVYMFQCEETGADHIRSDLDKVIQNRGGDVEPRRVRSDIRINLENIISQHAPGSHQPSGPRPGQRERPPPPEYQAQQWNNRDPEYVPLPRVHTQQGETYQPDFNRSQNGQEDPQLFSSERNLEILNHILDDVEIFVNKMPAAANTPGPKEKKSLFKKKKTKKSAPAVALPHQEEYGLCLQKIKYGFNLLAQLDGMLTNPSAPDYVHIFFSILATIVPQYPTDLPPAVISPLLTNSALELLDKVTSPEEDELWRSLGDSWNVPRSSWPDGDVSLYTPEFYDGWQPPASSQPPSQHPREMQWQPPASSQPPSQHPREMQWQPEEPIYMRVIYDFMARNNQELSIMKGEVVQVIQKSKQWWLVRNSRDEEGHIPQHVLEPLKGGGSSRPMEHPHQESRGPAAALDTTSSPADVRAWLEHKGFSKITASSLGVLNGKLLLGMSKDEIRAVCPEEGARVFFQLQAIRAAIALASEPSYGDYNSRY